uniref:Uncharacterized protein n=1 Tax=Romanomermis culicivorax TaxID=13658 RepID=A0A915I6M7_ROMCU
MVDKATALGLSIFCSMTCDEDENIHIEVICVQSYLPVIVKSYTHGDPKSAHLIELLTGIPSFKDHKNWRNVNYSVEKRQLYGRKNRKTVSKPKRW